MASRALADLLTGLAEVDALQRANPTPQQGGGLTRPEVVRAMGRAEVVLLSSHFERYIYALNEEAIEWIVEGGVRTGRLPQGMRLLHSRSVIDALAATQWDNREKGLRSYSEQEATLWLDDEPVTRLVSGRLLEGMKAPKCRDVERFFRLWGINNIFAVVTRSNVSRSRLRLRLDELVSKRNNIAHGDLTVEARYLDIGQYKAAVRKFCTSADKAMARSLARLTGLDRPW